MEPTTLLELDAILTAIRIQDALAELAAMSEIMAEINNRLQQLRAESYMTGGSK